MDDGGDPIGCIEAREGGREMRPHACDDVVDKGERDGLLRGEGQVEGTGGDPGACGNVGDPHRGIPVVEERGARGGQDVGAAVGVGMARHQPSLVNEPLSVTS